ncbi:MAG: hypothetical protein IPL19_05480 [Sandaracinaceae bacterium]|nr:hypothetical protein [Sandaracinaceae bacterium]
MEEGFEQVLPAMLCGGPVAENHHVEGAEVPDSTESDRLPQGELTARPYPIFAAREREVRVDIVALDHPEHFVRWRESSWSIREELVHPVDGAAEVDRGANEQQRSSRLSGYRERLHTPGIWAARVG